MTMMTTNPIHPANQNQNQSQNHLPALPTTAKKTKPLTKPTKPKRTQVVPYPPPAAAVNVVITATTADPIQGHPTQILVQNHGHMGQSDRIPVRTAQDATTDIDPIQTIQEYPGIQETQDILEDTAAVPVQDQDHAVVVAVVADIIDTADIEAGVAEVAV